MGKREAQNRSYDNAIAAASQIGEDQVHSLMRRLCQEDLFYLLTRGLARADINRDWLFDRCEEVQNAPDGYIDLWAREHYKSTIITYGKTIQDILNNPEITVGIFSHTKPIARAFLRQIKYELETNERLKFLFSDILYAEPKKADNWSEEKGITVKRESNPKEATVEAHGLVDGQPTSKHFSLLVYDDVVTRESVTTPEMIEKVTDAWALSLNLGADGGDMRIIGTRYHFNDTYRTIMKRGAAIARIHPATDNGKVDGVPVFLTREALDKKRRDQGSYVFACHGAGTFVTMGDWSQKPIKDIIVGDVVIGWDRNSRSGRAKLRRSIVESTKSRVAETVKSTLANNDTLIHTPDHKWWSGRTSENGKRSEYAPLGFKARRELDGVCQAVDLSYSRKSFSLLEHKAAAYLAGIIDGEGSVKHKTIQITQDSLVHPEVCEKIEWALNLLGIEYGVFERNRESCNKYNHYGVQKIYNLLGGRQLRVWLLDIMGGCLAKRRYLEDHCLTTKNFGLKTRVKLISQEHNGRKLVYNIQTETGNYLANGYCSKNCQQLQDPKADDAQGFNLSDMRYYDSEPDPFGFNFYILVDPANDKKKKSDYTSCWVLGLGPDRNYYIFEIIRDRLNLTERADMVMRLHQEYQPMAVGYEQYGMQADIQHIEYVQGLRNYRFGITPLGGTMAKNDRIRRLIPLFEAHRFWFPRTHYKTNYEGKREDLVKAFLDDEMESFPVMLHDDMLDGLARITDPDLAAAFPKMQKRYKKPSWRDKLKRKAMGGSRPKGFMAA